jgi:hypothetical protein
MSVFLLPVLAEAMTIGLNVQVSALLKPDVLRGGLSFEEEGKNQNTIKDHLNIIVAEMKRIDPSGRYCHGGGYTLSPRYRYKENTQEFIGYSGYLTFGCEFLSIDQYNEVNTAIDKVRSSTVRKNQGALSWGVSALLERETQNKLRLELLRRAETQGRVFSKETGMVCETASIHFGAVPRVVPMQVRGMALMDATPTESPMESEAESAVEAFVDYNCSKRVP